MKDIIIERYNSFLANQNLFSLEHIKNKIIDFFHNFENEQFCNNVEKEEEKTTNNFLHIKNSDITFNISMIKNIVNLIAKNNNYSMFESEINKNAICITGDYGYAYLLGCRNY